MIKISVVTISINSLTLTGVNLSLKRPDGRQIICGTSNESSNSETEHYTNKTLDKNGTEFEKFFIKNVSLISCQ